MKTTQKEFLQFRKDCLYYQELYMLGDWEITFDLKKLDERWAETAWNFDGMKANISLNSEYGSNHGKDFKKTAQHEVLHLVIAPLVRLICDNVNSREVNRTEHKVINHLLLLSKKL